MGRDRECSSPRRTRDVQVFTRPKTEPTTVPTVFAVAIRSGEHTIGVVYSASLERFVAIVDGVPRAAPGTAGERAEDLTNPSAHARPEAAVTALRVPFEARDHRRAAGVL